MCAKATTILNTHMSAYVRAVFADRLREEGFVNFNDKEISWYRCVNGEISNTISFFSVFNRPPLHPIIGQGIYPLFSDISIVNTAYGGNFGNDAVTEVFIEEGAESYRPYSEDIWIEAPTDGGRGIYTFNEIVLPEMNAITSITESYTYRKNKIIESYNSGSEQEKIMFPFAQVFQNLISSVFIDEAIYLDDYEVYSHCRAKLERLVATFGRWCQVKPNNSDFRKRLETAKLRKRVFDDNAREEYLQILEQRKQKNIAMLKKRYGIVINKEDSE